MRSGPDQRPRGRFNANRPFRQQPRAPQNNQTFESNGPNVKIRGSAHQIFERYIALAREASSAGDRIAAENLYQHAEHYYRIMQANGDGQNMGPPRPMTPADTEMNGMDNEGEFGGSGQSGQPQQQVQPQQSGQPQPMVSDSASDEGDGSAAL